MRRFRKLFPLSLMFAYSSITAVNAQANWKYISHDFKNNVLTITCDSGKFWIQPYSNKIIKVTLLNPGMSEPDSSNSVILVPEKVQTNLKDKSGCLEFSTPAITVRIYKQSMKIEFFRGNDSLVSNEEVYVHSHSRGLKFSLKPEECIYGGGFRSIPLNRRGHKLALYNAPHYGYGLNTENLNYCIPLVLSSSRYMLLVDNPQKGTLDIGVTKENEMTFDLIGGELTYYFIGGDSFEGLEKSYTDLTGRQPMPPRWVLGNLQSRMSYTSEAQTREIVDRMIKEDFPLDAIVLDLNWFGKFSSAHPNLCMMGNISWDSSNWQNPKQMMKDFSSEGINTVLVAEPYVVKGSKNFDYVFNNNLAATDSIGKPYVIKEFYFGEGLLFDIFKPATRDWFWQQYKKQVENGVAGWWGDLGEPEMHPSKLYHINGHADAVHNIYGHYWDKMLYDNYKKDFPKVRLFNLNRSGFAGSQRYGVYPWTGDVSRSWSGFQAQLPALLSMSMCGLGYIHSDLGGFTPGDKDEELYTRWLQFGTFSPVFRVHADAVIPPEPIFHSDTTKKIIREFIKLRYKLLPYNYTLAWLNSTTGNPLMRPLFYYDWKNILIRNYSDEYFWGDAFLIAPVLYKDQKEKGVYLPEGNWFDFWTDKKYEGCNTITENLRMDRIPVYVRAGSFIPMVAPVNNTSRYSSANLSVHYYFDDSIKTSSYTMYEDDGKTNGVLETGMYELLNFNADIKADGFTISLTKTGGKYDGMPIQRNIEFILHNIQKAPKYVSSGDKTFTPVWDKQKKQLRFTIPWKMDAMKIRIKY